MQPLHNFHFLPWHLMAKAAALKAQEKDLKPIESPPLSPLTQPQSKTMKDAEPKTDFPKGRRRNKNSSSALNVNKPEPVSPTYRRLRLKYQEEITNERKEKEEAVVVNKDYFASFMNSRSRTKDEHKQPIGQCSSTFIDPQSSSANGFSLSLSKKEIVEDFLLMTGKKPPRNPKKRKTSVQKRINKLCFGMELDSVCEEAYEVKEKVPTKQK